MKTIKYNLLFLLAIVLLYIPQIQAQQDNAKIQNQNIQQFIQVWGLVKYKSQKSIAGKFDADQVFLALIDSVKNADEKQFNQLMMEMVGPIDPSLTGNAQDYDRKKQNSYQHLLKNIDYSWIRDKGYSTALRQQLTALSNQVNLTGKHQYIPAVWYESDLPNEAPYATYAFNQEGMNLLALAKTWNAVEYLFPYKYMMDKDWKKVLTTVIPAFRKINNRTSYEQNILFLSEAVNDTHAGEFMASKNMKTTNLIFNVVYYPPFDYKVEAKSIIIKKFLNDSLARHSELKIGDQIVSINGIKMEQWLKERMALLPASNKSVKYRELSPDYNEGYTFAFSNLAGQILNVKVARGKTYLNLKLEMLDRRDRQHIAIIQKFLGQKVAAERSIKGRENIDHDITVIRAGHLFEKDFPEDKDLPQLSADLKSKKALIFDMREYPQGPGFFSYYLPLVLGKAPFAFARYYAVDLKDPGAFIHREGVENYMAVIKDSPKPMGELYTGKIVILTNEETQSMGEWFTMMLSQFNKNTTIIGSQTAGADGDLKRLILPGAYKFSFTGNGIFYPDGRETQRIGIKPDVYYKPSVQDLIGTADTQLQRAIKYIREGK